MKTLIITPPANYEGISWATTREVVLLNPCGTCIDRTTK